METIGMIIPVHSYFAEVNARGGLELVSYCVNRALVTFVCCVAQHSVRPPLRGRPLCD